MGILETVVVVFTISGAAFYVYKSFTSKQSCGSCGKNGSCSSDNKIDIASLQRMNNNQPNL